MITPEYAADHRKKLKAAVEAANKTCPKCGAIHGQTVRESERTGNKWVAYLQLSHPDHNPWDPNARTEVLCNGCHMGKDGPLHAANAKRTRELQKQGQMARYQRNSIPNNDILMLCHQLGIEMNFIPDDEGGCWQWASEITTGSHRELAMAFSQALFDLVMTYREADQTWRDLFSTCLRMGFLSGAGETVGGHIHE